MDPDQRLVLGPADPLGAGIAWAVPRISRKRTRHGLAEAMSSTTSAARPLRRRLRNFWLVAMLKPVTSIVPSSGLWRKPTGLTWGLPSGWMAASRPSRWLAGPGVVARVVETAWTGDAT